MESSSEHQRATHSIYIHLNLSSGSKISAEQIMLWVPWAECGVSWGSALRSLQYHKYHQ